MGLPSILCVLTHFVTSLVGLTVHALDGAPAFLLLYYKTPIYVIHVLAGPRDPNRSKKDTPSI